MSLKLEVQYSKFHDLNRNDINDINYVLTNSVNSTIFHTIEWSKILEQQFGINESILIARINDDPIGIYKFGTAKFYKIYSMLTSPVAGLETVYGGPVAVKGHDLVIRDLVRSAEQHAIIPLELSIQCPINYKINLFLSMGYKYDILYTSILDLNKTEENLWNGIDRKTRNLVRKAMKNGVNIIEGNLSDVPCYYNMILSTFNRAGIGHLPQGFYEKVISNLKPLDMAKMFLAEYEGTVIGGAIFLCYRNTIYYWHGASYKEYWDLAANNLIQWEIIKWGHTRGYRYYDLVRIEEDRLPGIAKFKMGWGGDRVEFYRLFKYVPFKPPSVAISIFRTLRSISDNVKKNAFKF